MATESSASGSDKHLSSTENTLVKRGLPREGMAAVSSREGVALAQSKTLNIRSEPFVKSADNRQSSVLFQLESDGVANQIIKSNDSKKMLKIERHNKSHQAREKRATSPTVSSKSHDFEIYDARVYLLDDIDGDGYYSEFQLEFDADTTYDWADVYAKLYVSYQGGPWELYHVTDVFEINGAQSSDEYRVTTVLNYDFPSGDYDILIDLYEYGYQDIVVTYSSDDDIDLYRIPLEDRENEATYGDGFWFYNVTTDLLDDNDNDGFYHRFALSFDVDSDYASADVYAEIYFFNEDHQWELEHTTDDFNVSGNSTLDTVHLEFDWSAGYPTAYYDFKIVIRDAYSNERLVETYSEFGALNAVPLESNDKDNSYNSGGSGNSGGATTNYESGGGSFLWSGLLMLLSLAFIRRHI
jgi:hypothetical protein